MCLPRMPLTTPEPQNTDTNGNPRNMGMTLLIAILTKNASFRGYCRFAYLFRAHIRNINMRRYITSARGHELNGRVRARAYHTVR